jgi:hypothetical protein
MHERAEYNENFTLTALCLEVIDITTISTTADSASNSTTQTISIWVVTTSSTSCWLYISSNTHLDVSRLFRKLPLDIECLLDEQGASSLKGVRGVGPLVRLDFDDDIVFEGMGNFVSREKHSRVKEQLSARYHQQSRKSQIRGCTDALIMLPMV